MSAPRPDRFGELKRRPMAQVLAALGVEQLARKTYACPACRADRRSSDRSDRRGPVGISSDGLGWHCHRCNAKGNAIGWLAFVVCGTDRPTEWGPVLRCAADRGLCSPFASPGSTPARPQLPPPPPPAPPEPPRRPGQGSVAQLWGACRPVLDDPEVCAWLASRALDAGDVEAFDLARALPVGLAAPDWASFRGSPWATAPQAYRLLVPLFDASGKMASLHARALHPQDEKGRDKASMPTGFEVRGLVMACPLGQRLLAGDAAAAELVALERDDGRPGLILAEGVPDFATWCTNSSDADELAPATLGLVSGSWSPELAARVPDGARVLVATHADPAGDSYASRITSTLAERASAGRIHLARWAED